MTIVLFLYGFSVYEWGVLDPTVGKVVTNPEPVHLFPAEVEAPVVYFYGEIPDSVEFTLDCPAKALTETSPAFTRLKGKPGWVLRPLSKNGGEEKSRPSTPCWDDPEATRFLVGDTPCNYIFYEAEVQFTQNLYFLPGKEEMTLCNAGRFHVLDVLCVGSDEAGTMWSAYFPAIQPGEPVLVRPGKMLTQVNAESRLLDLGFTEGAARAFANQWWPVFTTWPVRKSEESLYMPQGFISLTYRLCPEEIEEILPARVSPAPERFVRAWWVLAR